MVGFLFCFLAAPGTFETSWSSGEEEFEGEDKDR
jgi:hypothetical protein